MGQVSSAFDPNSEDDNSPVGYVTPPFPSLYNPSFVSTVQQRGFFLHDATAIWKFTFYWTLILLGGTFMACAALAVLSLLLSRLIVGVRHPESAYSQPRPTPAPGLERGPANNSRTPLNNPSRTRSRSTATDVPLEPLRSASSAGVSSAPGAPHRVPAHVGPQARKRPPLWLLLIIPLIMGATAACVALISGTVVGFALAAVYSAGGFSMSTWVPFMWGLIQVIVLIIASYSSLTRVL